jgi:hypothetical protein
MSSSLEGFRPPFSERVQFALTPILPALSALYFRWVERPCMRPDWPSISLDEICSGRQIDSIKVDTDGLDFPILRTLCATKPTLFFEWDPARWREQGEDPASVFDWLVEVGYEDFCLFADSESRSRTS